MGGARELEPLRPAVFFDRDGTLNEDFGYVHRFEDFRWLPSAKDAIRRLNVAGVYVFVVTNQSGVARGLFGEDAVTALHARMREDLHILGAAIDDFRYCPHHPDIGVGPYRLACTCRKPAPGMILDLIAHWPVDKAASVMVGDKAIDAEAGHTAGIAAEIVRSGELEEFVDRFLRRLGAERPWPGLTRPSRS
jgi:D-glycero-D-manno-heptose 1,7-bisphosphate phosphatase